MERKFYTDDFERLLKERSDEFRMYPSKRVWGSIYNDLHPGRKWPSIAVSLLLVFALFITGYWNSNTNTASKTIATKNTVVTNTATSIASVNTPVANHNTSGTTPSAYAGTASKNNDIVTAQPAAVPAQAAAIAAKQFIQPGGNHMQIAAAVIPSAKETAAGQPKNTAATTIQQQIQTSITATRPFPDNDAANTAVTTGTVTITEVNPGITELENDATGVTDAALTTTELAKMNQPAAMITTNKDFTAATTPITGNTIATSAIASAQKNVSAEDKSWIDYYALYNKPNRKKWKGRMAKEFYITPGVGFRIFSNNSRFDASAPVAIMAPVNNSGLNMVMDQKPGLGIEAGMGLNYSLSKKLRLKVGLQTNYTNYVIAAEETNHPVLTTLSLNDINTGYPYMASRTAILSNSPLLNSSKIHNSTLQLSLPVGLAVKLAGTDKLEWYAGAGIQPTYIIAGKANLISSDRKNYVSDPSLLRHWGLNAGIETYISYKFEGFHLQVGPQFRYQLTSTYSAQYTLRENLYNAGLKIGILKNF